MSLRVIPIFFNRNSIEKLGVSLLWSGRAIRYIFFAVNQFQYQIKQLSRHTNSLLYTILPVHKKGKSLS